MGVLVLKRRNATLYICLVLCCALAVGIASGRRARQRVRETAQLDTPVRTIVIDPGHGGGDGGAVGVSGVCEDQLNLEISLRLQALLRLLGQEPVMVRRTDVSIHDPEANTVSEKKVSDLHNRVALVNETPGALLLSIHHNHFPEPKYKGAQVFYAPTAGSRRLAELLQPLLRASLDPENHREAKPVDSAVYLLNHIDTDGVLIECGFLSNAEEEALLRTEAYQKKLAAVIAAATLQFMEDHNEV